jgi:hypothetical protein
MLRLGKTKQSWTWLCLNGDEKTCHIYKQQIRKMCLLFLNKRLEDQHCNWIELNIYNKQERHVNKWNTKSSNGCYWKQNIFLKEGQQVMEHSLELIFWSLEWQNKIWESGAMKYVYAIGVILQAHIHNLFQNWNTI